MADGGNMLQGKTRDEQFAIQRAGDKFIAREFHGRCGGLVDHALANRDDSFFEGFCEAYDNATSPQCPDCEGSGRIENEDYDAEDEDSEFEIDCEKCEGTGEVDPPEIYEYIMVSDWAGRLLVGQCEIVFDGELLGLSGVDVWGRQCTGQSPTLDPSIQNIVVAFGWHIEKPEPRTDAKVSCEIVYLETCLPSYFPGRSPDDGTVLTVAVWGAGTDASGNDFDATTYRHVLTVLDGEARGSDWDWDWDQYDAFEHALKALRYEWRDRLDAAWDDTLEPPCDGAEDVQAHFLIRFTKND